MSIGIRYVGECSRIDNTVRMTELSSADAGSRVVGAHRTSRANEPISEVVKNQVLSGANSTVSDIPCKPTRMAREDDRREGEKENEYNVVEHD